MASAQQLFDETLAIGDPGERAQAMCDLAFDAEQMAASGRREAAVELFELIATLDRYDDLLFPAIEVADEKLILLGVRQRPSLEGIVQELHAKYQNLDEYQRLLSVAKTLARKHGKRRTQAWKIAKDLLDAAEKIQPLGAKDLRFRAEVMQQIK
jgi:hypothetical protein